MTKPSIFFSHSSKDGDVLTKIKNTIIEKTGGAFDIFLSSDGQSIPFGKNWVLEIQEALERSKIVFVFLSPNSVGSGWVYFESGFSYSNKINVVPVTLFGLKVGDVPPPLGLLNGFEVFDADGLNKIIATINIELNQNHRFRFSKSAFEKIFIPSESERTEHSDDKIFSFEYEGNLEFELPEDWEPQTEDWRTRLWSDQEKKAEYLLESCQKLAERQGWQYSSVHGSIQIGGCSLRTKAEQNHVKVHFSAYGPAVLRAPSYWVEIWSEVLLGSFEGHTITISMPKQYDFDPDENRRAFKLHDAGMKSNPSGGYLFDDYAIYLHRRNLNEWSLLSRNTQISVRPLKDKFDISKMSELVNFLDATGIIVKRDIPSFDNSRDGSLTDRDIW